MSRQMSQVTKDNKELLATREEINEIKMELASMRDLLIACGETGQIPKEAINAMIRGISRRLNK